MPNWAPGLRLTRERIENCLYILNMFTFWVNMALGGGTSLLPLPCYGPDFEHKCLIQNQIFWLPFKSTDHIAHPSFYPKSREDLSLLNRRLLRKPDKVVMVQLVIQIFRRIFGLESLSANTEASISILGPL